MRVILTLGCIFCCEPIIPGWLGVEEGGASGQATISSGSQSITGISTWPQKDKPSPTWQCLELHC